jgi:hypothetical protein
VTRERDKYTASRSGRKGGREKEARGACGERESERERERERQNKHIPTKVKGETRRE